MILHVVSKEKKNYKRTSVESDGKSPKVNDSIQFGCNEYELYTWSVVCCSVY